MTSSGRPIRRVSDNLRLCKLIVWLWIGCIVVTVVSSQDNFYTNGRFGKRHGNVPLSRFQPGPRFGRSGGGGSGLGKGPKGMLKLYEIFPRMDRFFAGSRFGKRSSLSLAVERRAPEFGPALDPKRFDYEDDVYSAEDGAASTDYSSDPELQRTSSRTGSNGI